AAVVAGVTGSFDAAADFAGASSKAGALRRSKATAELRVGDADSAGAVARGAGTSLVGTVNTV
ncbi:MAG: hypothetical protein K2P79_02115, partial [Sphingomonas sp.]|nr:hypothetical protein [Sphingomonas sp.]